MALQNLAPDLWLLPYPLRVLGLLDLRRIVTVIRLASGRLIIHSTGPFTPGDVAAITALGEPTWIIDTLLRHDTFAKEGHAAFPSAVYLAPEGFSNEVATTPLIPPPAEWADEISVRAIDGAPEFGEVVLLHKPSRTLVVADLVIHFPHPQGLVEKALVPLATVGGAHAPGMTKPFKSAIKDPATFAASIRDVLAWDFDRVIVGHGEVIESGGREKLRTALIAAGVGVS